MTKFKTITITTQSPSSIIKELEKRGDYVSSYAKEIAEKMPKIKKAETFDVGIATLSKLGFTSNPTYSEITAKIKELGYELCPPKTGLQLRLDDEEQEKGTLYSIAIEPISGSAGSPFVFYVGRDGDGERWLSTGWADPDVPWRLDRVIVFRLSKSSELGHSELSTVPQSLESLDLESRVKSLESDMEKIRKFLII